MDAATSKAEIILANWYHFTYRIALTPASLSTRRLEDSTDDNMNGMYSIERDGTYAIWKQAGAFMLLLPSGIVPITPELHVTVEGTRPERLVKFFLHNSVLWIGRSRIEEYNISPDPFPCFPQDEEDVEFLIFLNNVINNPDRLRIGKWTDAEPA